MTRLVTPPLEPTRHVTRTFASSSCSHRPATRRMLDGMRPVLIGVVVCVVSVGSATVARALLHGYRWPGNVRELRNVIERVVIMVPGPVVTALDLAFLAATPVRPDSPPVQAQRPARLQDARDQFERDFIVQALTEQHGNITRTAEALGMERSNLYRKMRSFGIRSSR